MQSNNKRAKEHDEDERARYKKRDWRERKERKERKEIEEYDYFSLKSCPRSDLLATHSL